MKPLRHAALQWALGLAMGAVFVYASFEKIEKPADFARIVYHYEILGPNRHLGPLPANVFAVTLPWVEAVAGLLLIAGFWRREAALVVALLLVLFIGAVGWALVQGIDIENCGCFTVGAEGRRAGWSLLLGDFAMLAAALALVGVKPKHSFGPPLEIREQRE